MLHIFRSVSAKFSQKYFTLIDPLAKSLSTVGRGPVWGRDTFAWLSGIEARQADIASEIQAYFQSGNAMIDKEDLFPGKTTYYGMERWELLHLMIYDQKFEDVVRHFPKTMAAIGCVPNCCSAMFSRLPPERKSIPRHHDANNGTLRIHLALKVPDSGDCYIEVAERTMSWRAGEAFVFDASAQHSARKEADEDRIVLIVDFIRPMPRFLQWLTYRLYVQLRGASIGKNLRASYRQRLENVTPERPE